jgi:predicted transcriptional regulator
MELINLDHCAINNKSMILKKESLLAFISKNENYDVEKICIALEINRSVLKKWIAEINLAPLKSYKFRIVKVKEADPSLSQREIARIIGCSVGSVNKALKKLT